MGTARKNVNLSTGKHDGSSSVFLIDIEPSKVAYFYDVELFTMQGNVQKKKITGAFVDLNRKISVELVRIALNKSGRLTPKAAFVYDGRKNIYLSEELKPGQNEWIVPRKEVSEFVRQNYDEGVNFKVRIKPCQTGHHILNLDDFAQYEKGRNNSVDQEDRSLRTFLELAIAQKAWESGKFIAYGSGLLFHRQEENITFRSNPAITFHSGFCKGVRIVEGMGTEGKGQPAVVLDAKVSAFLKPQNLEKTIGDFSSRGSNEMDWKKIGQFLNGVKVKCAFEPSRILTIAGFGDKPLKDETFPMEKNGKTEQIFVVNYLKEKYRKMNLKNLDWPGIFTTSNRDVRFPVEQLMVLEGQKIPQEKQTRDLVDILLKKNSIPPQERHKKIEEAGKELELWNGKNKVLEAFGIKVRPDSNNTNFNVFAAPHLLYKNGKEVVPSGDKGDWSKNSGTFIDARAPNKWAVLYAKNDEKIVWEFVGKMKQKCVEKGMKVPQMSVIPGAQKLFDPNSGKQYLDEWRKCFKLVYNSEFDFLLLIDEKMTNTHSHGLLKLFEVFERQRKLPLITQQITMETVKNVLEKNQSQTMDNIVNKMNIKFGGLNYKPILQNAQKSELAKFEQRFDVGNGDILVIGYDVSHPTQKIHERKWGKKNESEFEEFEEDKNVTSTEPSVVGICANMAENPHNFVGDYFYQKAKKEAVDLDQLKARSKWILASLEANRPKQSRPKCIFVIRDGLSEGQLRMAYKEELKAIKDGFLEHDPNYHPKFALIIGNKRHSKKLFSVAKEQIENMPPCSVIQDKIVRLDIDEFYMQPHYPIKGTGKPVEYVILVNEIIFGCNKSELQEYVKLIALKVPKVSQVPKELEERMFEKSLVNLLLLLSYDHQIVSKPISLTEPAYQADELAKRGHANFATLKQYFSEEIPYSDEKRIGKNLVDYGALTAKLSYWGDGLVALKNRFTA